MAHDVYDDMFAIIVRPNKNMKHLNEEFVVKDLCKGKNYFKYNFFTLCPNYGLSVDEIWFL